MAELWEMNYQGGPVLTAIALLSTCGWFLIASTFFELQAEFQRNVSWLERVRSLAMQRDVDQARAVVPPHGGLLAPVVQAALQVDDHSRRSFRLRVYPLLVGAEQYLGRNLRLIGSMGAAAPLLGLLGTVTGMMQTFAALARTHVGQPGELADGISQALLTTQAGLVVALPIVLAHRHLTSRLRRYASTARLQIASLEGLLCDGFERSGGT